MSALHGSARPPPPAAGSRPRFPDFFLLEEKVSIRDVRNETTAAALTESGLTVQVSFAVADPPRLSSCCVYCTNRDESPFANTPEISCSVEDAVLIRVVFTAVRSEATPRYFLYRARGPYGGPSLDLLPDIRQYSRAEHLLEPHLGFVSHDNCKQFVMAALSYGPGYDGQYYNLHTIGSQPDSTWSKKLLKVEIPDGLTAEFTAICPTQVIALGGGLVGWVDLGKGILICDVLNPAATTASFVPMPKLLPSNNEIYCDRHSARPIRDVTVGRGYIKCVELEELVKLRPATVLPAVPDPWDMEQLNDSELAISPPEEEEEVYDLVGWRLITWYRALDWNCWRRGNMVHSDDLGTVSLPQLGGGALNVTFKNLKAASPTLCGDDDVVYLMSMLQEDDQAA